MSKRKGKIIKEIVLLLTCIKKIYFGDEITYYYGDHYLLEEKKDKAQGTDD